MSTIAMRTCTGCNVEKPLTLKYFPASKTCREGISTRCRSCAVLMAKIHRKYGPRTPRVPVPEGHRSCQKCKLVKPLTVEHFSCSIAAKKTFNYACKPCRAKDAKVSSNPPVSDSELTKFCRTCLVTYPHILEYFARNPRIKCGLNPRCKSCCNKSVLKWRIANPEKYKYVPQLTPTQRLNKALNRRLWRARRKNATGTHTVADIQRRLKGQQNRCHWCGVSLLKAGIAIYHVDHLIALARGGSDGPENLVCACSKCNMSKGAKLPHEWIGRLM